MAGWRFIRRIGRIPDDRPSVWCSVCACANFALRKTANDNVQHFSSDVTSTIKRNFYVDDCLVLTAKKILEDLCRIKLGWDDEVPPEHSVRWQRWLKDLPKLSQLTIDRCLKPADFKDIASSQLHHFSDASEIGFGSVSYLCLVDSTGRIHCTIPQGKSRPSSK